MLVGFINPRQQQGYMTERAPRLMSDNFTCCHTRQSGETMTSVSAVHIILTPTQPGGTRLPQWESNPGPPNQELCALLILRAPSLTYAEKFRSISLTFFGCYKNLFDFLGFFCVWPFLTQNSKIIYFQSMVIKTIF